MLFNTVFIYRLVQAILRPHVRLYALFTNRNLDDSLPGKSELIFLSVDI